MDETRVPRPLRFAGLGAGIFAGVPVVVSFLGREEPLEPVFLSWAGMAIGFLGLFWWLSGTGCERRGRAVILASLGALTGLGLGLAALGGSAFGGVYPVLVTTVLGGRVRERVADGWILAQGAALWPVFRWAGYSGANALVLAFVFAGLSVFVLYTTRVAARERDVRREREATNRELLATRRELERRARDAERLAIARDLHDVMGHHLTALSLTLEAAARGPANGVDERLAEAQVLTKRLLRDTRKVVSTLRTEPPEDLDAGLRRLALEVRSPRIHVEPGNASGLSAAAVAAILRCTREIATNAARHGAAENLWVTTGSADGRFVLEARDDGRGGDDAAAGHGLSGMRERVQPLGGDVEWRAEADGGFVVELWVPVSAGGIP